MPRDLAATDAPLAAAAEAAATAQALLDTARAALRRDVTEDGKVAPARLEAAQHRAHGLAWLATTAEALRQLHLWADALDEANEADRLVLRIGAAELVQQLIHGIPMNQQEVARPADLGLGAADLAPLHACLAALAPSQDDKSRLAALLADGISPATGAGEEMDMVADQFRRWADEKVRPHAHEWHLSDALIPRGVIDEMAEMGVFGLTIPEEHGGLGMSKMAMCVTSEELSRAWIAVGSLGTRSEIAAELILAGGTEEQKAQWLPRIASAEILPTAVFTEPNTGSDLGALRTRAERDGDDWRVTGNKTWITHAARADVMTLLARTDPATDDYRGLSMFLAEKTPGPCEAPFPDEGISGGEIEVLGYRGMKEYELAFDGFRVDGANLLGGEEGRGFKQLMQTFESARIQTAARAVGVAQSALDLALRYATERRQFGKPLIAFPRVANKIALMACWITIARQITYFSARQKDEDRRCDLEAGMAKLLGARVAWAAADDALQVHGGNGFALEYEISRVLQDARILNIFEGAAEIQAQVIARRLLG
ncbi:MAG: acyl-CoA dehydrogenase family protein [Hasllibacter sp.]